MTTFDPTMSPADFFEILIPQLAAAKAAELSDAQKAVRHAVAIVLKGADGGEWTVMTDGGTVSVNAGVADHANPVFELDVETFRGVMTGEKAIVGVNPDPSKLDVSRIKPELQQRLAPIKGTLKVVVESEDDDVQVTIRFGSGAPSEPTTTISLPIDIAKSLQSGAMNPQMAFMQGGIKIAGDMNLAMQVATLQM